VSQFFISPPPERRRVRRTIVSPPHVFDFILGDGDAPVGQQGIAEEDRSDNILTGVAAAPFVVIGQLFSISLSSTQPFLNRVAKISLSA